jgi:hypothetical protein
MDLPSTRPRVLSVDRPESQKVSDSDRKDIHVLWLSADVFISSINFHLSLPAVEPLPAAQPQILWDYKVALHQNPRHFYLYAYLLGTFQDEPLPPLGRLSSRLPLDFLGHLTTPLPASLEANFFSSLSFTRSNPQTVPVEYIVRFLSIVPLDVSLDTGWALGEKGSIDFSIGNAINKEELEAILSHPFHPGASLSFSQHNSLHDAVTSEDLQELLRQRCNLRSIYLPAPMNSWDVDDDFLVCCDDSDFDSWDLKIHFSVSYLTVSMLKDISTTMRDCECASIDCPSFVWNDPEQCRGKLSTLLQTLLLCFQCLRHLEICFDWERDEHDLIDLLRCVSSTLRPFRSASLCSFKIKFIGETLDPSRHGDYFKSFDTSVSPTLVLNRYRNHGPKFVRGGVLPLAVRAVNIGIPYRNTMDNTPYDMSIANVGLNFLLVRNEVKKPIERPAIRIRRDMLKWTCRLRDLLIQRGYWASSDDRETLSTLREAEFFSEGKREGAGTFPGNFGWNAFIASIRLDFKRVVLRGYPDDLDQSVYGPAFDTGSALHQVLRWQSGTKVTDFEKGFLDIYLEDIDVLWLSRTVFISAIDFSLSLPGTVLLLSDYQVVLQSDISGWNSVVLYAYSFAFFESTTIPPTESVASVLPLEFLAHLISSLPKSLQADFFTQLMLTFSHSLC